MYRWAENDKAIVYFDEAPHVSIRYKLPSDTKEEVKSKKKYPFTNKKSLTIRLVDKIKDRTYQFDIPKGRNFDGASIPRIFWRIIGAPTDNSFLIAALVHDELCLRKELVWNDRQFSSEVFNALLESAEVNKVKRYLMFHSVNLYQKLFCDWGLEWDK